MDGQKVKHLNLGMHNISVKYDDNQKKNLKWCWKKNVHAHFPQCYLKNNLFLPSNIIYSNGRM
jgi:hypothetical protein